VRWRGFAQNEVADYGIKINYLTSTNDLIVEGKALSLEWLATRIRSRKKQRLICWFGKR
jgi:hypothetical protein